MIIQPITLDGPWKLVGIDPQGERKLELTGQVPGHVHPDLQAAGIIPDPFWRDQVTECQWVEKWDWHYSREFEVIPGMDTSWAVLEFAGLDTFAVIILNGREIGRTENMFVPHRFEVGGLLKTGANLLAVQFLTQNKVVGDKPFDRYASLFVDDRVFVRRMQCTYGWDWVHRMVSHGIWRPVTLSIYDSARIDDAFVYTEKLEEGLARLQVEVTTERRTSDPLRLKLEIRDPQDQPVWRGEYSVEGPVFNAAPQISNPQLWWPNGIGEHPLYTLHVTLGRPNQASLETRAIPFGIRTVAHEEIPDEIGSSYTVLINGQRIFCKGANWVPADPFPSRITPEHYGRLVQLAHDGNTNLLRIWGGGIYEPEPFWQACDRLGVMVSQDFVMACADYPEDDPEFLEQLRQEFAKAIRLLRNHPSLIFWAGNNENGIWGDQDADFAGKKISVEIAGPLLRRLDPARPFRITSPYGGKINNCREVGDCHDSAWFSEEFFRSDMTDYYERVENFWGRFLSESAVPGAPPMRTLLRFMTPEDVADPKGVIWDFHTKDNPYKGFDDMNQYDMLEITARKMYGERTDIAAKVATLEYVQYDWIRMMTEAARRRKYFCSAIQYWMYNDCWPASGWAMIDYYGFPKAGWHGARRSFAPVIASIQEKEGEIRLWVCNDRLEAVRGTLTFKVQPWQGEALLTREIGFDVPANQSVVVRAIPQSELEGIFGPQTILICDLETAQESDRAFYYRGLPKNMELPAAKLIIQQEGNGRVGSVTIHTDNYARVVELEADLDFSDNYFEMLPGEKRTIRWTAPREPFTGAIPVRCWNQAGAD